MYRHNTINKKRLISNILLILAIILLMVGIVFIAADIAKRNLRQEKIDQGTVSMDQAIAENIAAQATATGTDIEEPVVTMLVGTSDLEISGEDYDYFGTEEEIAAQREAVEQELQMNEEGYFENDMYILSDIKPKNVLYMEGDMYVIDAEILKK